MRRPLALTLGEPAGIGPDITLAIWLQREALQLPPFYVLADPEFLTRRAHHLGLMVPLRVVEPAAAAAAFQSALPVVALAERVTAQPGRPDETSGPAA
ncbi:MAG: 4-hydroxythreonine-4-phosphate dehydrogenase, partial [Alphaproteobacteria bacterium]|nr:4-hydroxythreonine-4-phosphate dehydrogenase [Alphaproteobacteria bacterium]